MEQQPVQQWEYCNIRNSRRDTYYIAMDKRDGSHIIQARKIPKYMAFEYDHKKKAYRVDGNLVSNDQLSVAQDESANFHMQFEGLLIAELGAEGWEMVGIAADHDIIYFKRPVGEELRLS